MKNRNVWFLIGLLFVNSSLFCDIDRSMNKATTNLYYATIAAVRAAIAIGISSYVVDMLLCRFDATKNMENREFIATGSCAVLYAILLVSAEYQRLMEQPDETLKREYVSGDQDCLQTDENKFDKDQQIDNQDV